jgi:hypothetical protein
MLLIGVGCSKKDVVKHNYKYTGENELWSAEYKVNSTGIFTEKHRKVDYESNSDTTLTVTYKKDLSELSSVKGIEISYKSSVKGGEITKEFSDAPPDEKSYTIKSSSKGAAIERKDEVIKVDINIDGNIQTIELKNSN